MINNALSASSCETKRVQSGTASGAPERYRVYMPLKQIKLTIAVVWLIAIAIFSILSGVSSPSGWLLLAATAVLPPLAMMRYWHDPDQTMSERIHQAIE